MAGDKALLLGGLKNSVKRQIQPALLVLLFASAGWIPQAVLAEKIYKCRNPNGVLIYTSSPCAQDVVTLRSWEVTAKPRHAESLKLQSNPSGHFTVEGKVSNEATNFVIDTGASIVSIPENIAKSAQLVCAGSVNVQTANGSVDACKTVIPSLKFGPFELHQVDAIIAPNLYQSLLGMNVLNKYKISHNQGEMLLTEQ